MKKTKFSKSFLYSACFGALIFSAPSLADGLNIQAFPQNFKEVDDANQKAKERLSSAQFDPSKIEPAAGSVQSGEVKTSQALPDINTIENLFGRQDRKKKRLPKPNVEGGETGGGQGVDSENATAVEDPTPSVSPRKDSPGGALELLEDPFLLKTEEEPDRDSNQKPVKEIKPRTNMPYPEDEDPSGDGGNSSGPGQPVTSGQQSELQDEDVDLNVDPINKRIVIGVDSDEVEPNVVNQEGKGANIVEPEEGQKNDDPWESLKSKQAEEHKQEKPKEVIGRTFNPKTQESVGTVEQPRTAAPQRQQIQRQAEEQIQMQPAKQTQKKKAQSPQPLLKKQDSAQSREPNKDAPRAIPPGQRDRTPKKAVAMPSQEALRAVPRAVARKPAAQRLEISPSPYSYSVPSHVTQNPRLQQQAQTLGRAMSNRWEAFKGGNLREILNQWSRESGVRLLWVTDNDYSVMQPVQMQGSYEEAVQGILDQFRGMHTRPVGRLHIDPNTQERTLIIQTLFEG